MKGWWQGAGTAHAQLYLMASGNHTRQSQAWRQATARSTGLQAGSCW